MGSTDDTDRKRRHFSVSPTSTPTKKHPFMPVSDDKKMDSAVLQFQNQKLVQKLEVQKIEHAALERTFATLSAKQLHNSSIVKTVNKSWNELLDNLDCHFIVREAKHGHNIKHVRNFGGKDETPSSPESALLFRLTENGATESSSMNNCLNNIEENIESKPSKNIEPLLNVEKKVELLHNIELVIDDLRHDKDKVSAAVLKLLPQDGSSRQKSSSDIYAELNNLRRLVDGLHVNYRSSAREIQSHLDDDAKVRIKLKHLKGQLEKVVAELEETHNNVAALKAGVAKGVFFPLLNVGNKHVSCEKVGDKQVYLQELESILKELQDQASSRLEEVKALHEDRAKIVQELTVLQNTLTNVNCITSSQGYLLLRDQLENSRLEVNRHQGICEKLQMEKDSIAWREVELNIKNDIVDVYKRCSAVADSRITDLGMGIQKQLDERKVIEAKLEGASREQGRQAIIADFKALVSRFPEEMETMQSQLSKYKDDAVDIHSLRADVQSLSRILDRKVKECKTLSSTAVEQVAEITNLQAVVQDLQECDMELKLILDMYRRECSDSGEMMEARDSDYWARARIESLKSSLDEHTLERRVKTAIEAEAVSQQKLAAAEAEIVELRQRLEASKRDRSHFTDTLKSKNEENETYLSEIESIGQAYDDMQTQNQQLLQQITERDDYNIKLVLEGVRARQVQDSLLIERLALEKQSQQSNASLDFFNVKVGRMEDQMKFHSEKVQRLGEDRAQRSVMLDNTRNKQSDMIALSQQVRESLMELQCKVNRNRDIFVSQQIELDTERYKQKRIEEDLEVVKRKAAVLEAEKEGSIVGKLQEELKEYKEILKCKVCHDRPKEVVITKCYHLVCNPCIQRVVETRHRKCPVCGASFGTNDVKPVYI